MPSSSAFVADEEEEHITTSRRRHFPPSTTDVDACAAEKEAEPEEVSRSVQDDAWRQRCLSEEFSLISLSDVRFGRTTRPPSKPNKEGRHHLQEEGEGACPSSPGGTEEAQTSAESSTDLDHHVVEKVAVNTLFDATKLPRFPNTKCTLCRKLSAWVTERPVELGRYCDRCINANDLLATSYDKTEGDDVLTNTVCFACNVFNRTWNHFCRHCRSKQHHKALTAQPQRVSNAFVESAQSLVATELRKFSRALPRAVTEGMPKFSLGASFDKLEEQLLLAEESPECRTGDIASTAKTDQSSQVLGNDFFKKREGVMLSSSDKKKSSNDCKKMLILVYAEMPVAEFDLMMDDLRTERFFGFDTETAPSNIFPEVNSLFAGPHLLQLATRRHVYLVSSLSEWMLNLATAMRQQQRSPKCPSAVHDATTLSPTTTPSVGLGYHPSSTSGISSSSSTSPLNGNQQSAQPASADELEAMMAEATAATYAALAASRGNLRIGETEGENESEKRHEKKRPTKEGVVESAGCVDDDSAMSATMAVVGDYFAELEKGPSPSTRAAADAAVPAQPAKMPWRSAAERNHIANVRRGFFQPPEPPTTSTTNSVTGSSASTYDKRRDKKEDDTAKDTIDPVDGGVSSATTAAPTANGKQQRGLIMSGVGTNNRRLPIFIEQLLRRPDVVLLGFGLEQDVDMLQKLFEHDRLSDERRRRTATATTITMPSVCVGVGISSSSSECMTNQVMIRTKRGSSQEVGDPLAFDDYGQEKEETAANGSSLSSSNALEETMVTLVGFAPTLDFSRYFVTSVSLDQATWTKAQSRQMTALLEKIHTEAQEEQIRSADASCAGASSNDTSSALPSTPPVDDSNTTTTTGASAVDAAEDAELSSHIADVPSDPPAARAPAPADAKKNVSPSRLELLEEHLTARLDADDPSEDYRSIAARNRILARKELKTRMAEQRRLKELQAAARNASSAAATSGSIDEDPTTSGNTAATGNASGSASGTPEFSSSMFLMPSAESGMAVGVVQGIARVFGRRFIKQKRISTSNWAKDVRSLRPAQALYAARDAYVPIVLFDHLRRVNRKEEGNNAEPSDPKKFVVIPTETIPTATQGTGGGETHTLALPVAPPPILLLTPLEVATAASRPRSSVEPEPWTTTALKLLAP